MRIHHLQHVPFEGLGSIEPYFLQQGHQLSSTHLYLGQVLPYLDSLDWLIVMGGPMGVHDEAVYPWLAEEKAFIRNAIDNGKLVLGICLGAQLIADVLGARVYRNEHREIGWFPITPSVESGSTIFGKVFPDSMDVFHWHGDTFDIPSGGVLLASSAACKNQGFSIDDRIVALQFHLETTPDSARALIDNGRDELDGSHYVQAEADILSESPRFRRINDVMRSLLHKIERHKP